LTGLFARNQVAKYANSMHKRGWELPGRQSFREANTINVQMTMNT